MNRIVKLAATTAMTAAGLGALLIAPSTAQAAPGTCTTLSNGSLCINYDPQGYAANYTRGNQLQDSPYLDFNLVCDSGRRFGDGGAFPAAAGSYHSYVFSVGAQGRCHVTMYNRTNGGQFDSPSITR